MAELTNIDVRRKFGVNAMQQFRANQNDDTIVTMFIEDNESMFEKPLSELRQFFEDENIESMVQSDDCVIYFMTETKVLTITGLDYTWWIAPIRGKKYGRLKRLFNDDVVNVEEEKKEKNVRSIDIHKCEIFKPAGENLGSIAVFEGKSKDLLAFVNKHRQIDMLKTFFKSDLQYSFDDGPLKTYEQLVDDGIFVIEKQEN